MQIENQASKVYVCISHPEILVCNANRWYNIRIWFMCAAMRLLVVSLVCNKLENYILFRELSANFRLGVNVWVWCVHQMQFKFNQCVWDRQRLKMIWEKFKINWNYFRATITLTSPSIKHNNYVFGIPQPSSDFMQKCLHNICGYLLNFACEKREVELVSFFVATTNGPLLLTVYRARINNKKRNLNLCKCPLIFQESLFEIQIQNKLCTYIVWEVFVWRTKKNRISVNNNNWYSLDIYVIA